MIVFSSTLSATPLSEQASSFIESLPKCRNVFLDSPACSKEVKDYVFDNKVEIDDVLRTYLVAMLIEQYALKQAIVWRSSYNNNRAPFDVKEWYIPSISKLYKVSASDFLFLWGVGRGCKNEAAILLWITYNKGCFVAKVLELPSYDLNRRQLETTEEFLFQSERFLPEVNKLIIRINNSPESSSFEQQKNTYAVFSGRLVLLSQVRTDSCEVSEASLGDGVEGWTLDYQIN